MPELKLGPTYSSLPTKARAYVPTDDPEADSRRRFESAMGRCSTRAANARRFPSSDRPGRVRSSRTSGESPRGPRRVRYMDRNVSSTPRCPPASLMHDVVPLAERSENCRAHLEPDRAVQIDGHMAAASCLLRLHGAPDEAAAFRHDARELRSRDVASDHGERHGFELMQLHGIGGHRRSCVVRSDGQLVLKRESVHAARFVALEGGGDLVQLEASVGGGRCGLPANRVHRPPR